jgi:hypothetical protein
MQAKLPFEVALCASPDRGRSAWDWWVWKLPEGNVQDVIAVHEQTLTVCVRDRMKRRLSEIDNSEIAELCRHPAIQIPTSLVMYIIKEKLSIQPNPSNLRAGQSRIHARVDDLRSDPELLQEALTYITLGMNVADMRFTNGRTADAAFQLFEDELREYLESRSALVPHDRRHEMGDRDAGDSSSVLRRAAAAAEQTTQNTPVASSIPLLRSVVEQRMRRKPDVLAKLISGAAKIPSVQAISDRLCPSNPCHLASKRQTGTSLVMWKIQRRDSRKPHEDAHYVNAQWVLLRQFVLLLQAAGYDSQVLSADDKCKISVGEPGAAQHAATRTQRVLAGAFNVAVVQLLLLCLTCPN